MYDPGPDDRLPEQIRHPLLKLVPLLGLLVLLMGFCGRALAADLDSKTQEPAVVPDAIQDSPDGFPGGGLRSKPQPPKAIPFLGEEEGQVEVLTLDPPEPEAQVLPFLCVDSETECRTALVNGCTNHMKKPVVDLSAITYDSVERTCSGRCPDGTRIKCEVQPVNQPPKLPPGRRPGEV